MQSNTSRRDFIRNSLYAAGAAGLGAGSIGQVFAQAAPAMAIGPASGPAPEIINIGANTLSIGPSAPAREALVGMVPDSGGYGGPARELVSALSAQLGVPADHISLYPGSGTPLDLVVMNFTGPDRALVTADPTYEQAWRTGPKVGAKVIKVAQRKDCSHDVQGLCAADPKAGLIYLCNPNNPTGAITTRKDIEYAAAHKPEGTILVVDEAYIHLSDNAVSAADLVNTVPGVVVLRTFSKLYGMAGLRLGYAVAKPEILKKMNFWGGGSVSVTTLAAGLASVTDPKLVPERRAMIKKSRTDTIAWLTKQGYACTPSESNCFMVNINKSAKEFQNAMATHGVMIGRSWPGYETWPRISVGTEQEMMRFREAFTAVMAGKMGPLPVPTRQRMAMIEEDPARAHAVC